MIKKGIGSYFTLGEYKEINKEKVKKVDGIIKIGMSGTMCTMGAWGKYQRKFEICEFIGNTYGVFFVKDGQYCIDTFDELYKYNTCEELLFDWLDTLIEYDEATGENMWSEEIAFIKELKGGGC